MADWTSGMAEKWTTISNRKQVGKDLETTISQLDRHLFGRPKQAIIRFLIAKSKLKNISSREVFANNVLEVGAHVVSFAD